MRPTVWYVAYGSNCSTERFRCYIDGGTPMGAARSMVGCREPKQWRSTFVHACGWPVSFAEYSTVWDGATAFLGPDRERTGVSYVRVYEIEPDTFEDVVAQENRLPPGEVVLDWDALVEPGRHHAVGGRYGIVQSWGPRRTMEGLILSITGERSRPAAPSMHYLATIARGLCEDGPLTTAEVVDYLTSLPGARDAVDRDALLEAVDRQS